MGWLENVIFKNQEIENERLELTDKNSLYFLSTGLTLRNCTVVLKVPASRLVIKQATFIDCTFEVKQELKWPCFTFLDPIRRAPELRGVTWPGRFGRVTVEELHTQPAPTRSLTYHAPSIARRMETTEEELRAVIEKFDCIVY
jgi:hypothetical protein